MNAELLALDLILTAILQYVFQNKEAIDAMTPEEFLKFADDLQAKRKIWMSKYS